MTVLVGSYDLTSSFHPSIGSAEPISYFVLPDLRDVT